MPEFTLSGRADAPVEEVWKLLFDPSRFSEWWAGVQTVRNDGTDGYTLWLEGYPDFRRRSERQRRTAYGLCDARRGLRPGPLLAVRVGELGWAFAMEIDRPPRRRSSSTWDAQLPGA